MVLSILLLLILLFLSAFFSSNETAFTSLTLIQIQELKHRYKNRGHIIEELYMHPDLLLTTILIGNNFANVSISVISSAITIRLFGSTILGITTALLTLIILIFGEILPKHIALKNNTAICLRSARLIKGLSILFLPIIWLINRFSAIFIRRGDNVNRDHFTMDSILNMVKHAEDHGNIEDYKTKMVQSVFRFSDITVHSVMTHRQEVFTLNQDLKISEALTATLQKSFSRIPIYKDNPENITGVVLEKDIIRFSTKGKLDTMLSELAYAPIFIPETWKIHKVFRRLREERLNLAVILDEYGGLAGIVTIEDLVEEIIGELYDEDEEHEEVKIHRSQHDGWYTIRGDTPIHLLEEIFDASIEHDRNSETVGGYVLQQLSALPSNGQHINTDIGSFIILSVDTNRVQNLRYLPAKRD